nr:carbohydrate-binding protein [Elainella sp. Prado103]
SGLTYSIQNNSNPALFSGTTINASGQLVLDYATVGVGTADLTIRATDPQGAFVDTTFTVTVNPGSPTNTPPTTTGIANVTVVENAANSVMDYATTGTGSANLTVRATDPQGAFVDTTFTVTVTPPGSTQSLRIQAEDYRTGGQGVAYNDSTIGNQLGSYRSDDVDIQPTSDAGGGFNIGNIVNGEWLTYNVTLPQSGLFKVVARVATGQSSTKNIRAAIGGVTGNASFTNTGGWQKFQDVVVIPQVSLSAGSHVLRFDLLSSGLNFNYLELVSLNDVTNPSVNMPPVASDVTIANGSSGNYTLVIDYSDNVAIDLSTLGATDIRVTGPNGFNELATLISTTPSNGGASVRATYAVAPPGGTWDFADEGEYFVSLQANEVSDTSGNFVSGGQIGRFPITISQEDHFLHVVINAPKGVIDYDGDGDEIVPLRGDESHTHEFGAFLTGWTWTNGSTVLGTGANINATLETGRQQVTLTIQDNKSQTLSDSEFINVYPLNAVGGVLGRYYPTSVSPSTLLDNLPTSPGFIELLPGLAVEENNNTLGTSSITGNVVAVLTGNFKVTTGGTYNFEVTGGQDSRLYINGNLVTGAVTLAAGTTYSLETRVARPASATAPIQVLASVNGGATTVFTPDTLTNNQTNLQPFINDMPNQGSQFGGELITIEGVGFFEGEAANQVSVQWGNTTISGAALDIKQGTIKFLAPPGSGTVAVTVTTPNGTSQPASYSYSPSSVPIDFTDPRVVANVGAPTQAAWGPDGRLYVASITGSITALTFDDNYNVTNTQTIAGVSGLSNSNILGIAFNPYDAVPKIYVAHSQLFPGVNSTYNGQISMISGPSFSTVTPVVTGLPVSNHDHGINGMVFDNNGNLLVAVGGNTNAGIPTDKMGWLPESPLSGAILKVNLSDANSIWSSPPTIGFMLPIMGRMLALGQHLLQPPLKQPPGPSLPTS